MEQTELLQVITERVLAKMQVINTMSVPIGISNRHIHLCESDFKILFGEDAELHKKGDLKQPGQFAAEEVVTLKGPKGSIQKVRILGPFRKSSQIEISLTDSFTLGVPGVIRESGQLDGTPGIQIMGPKGSLELKQGVIVAARHIHMHPNDAKRMGLVDKDMVDVKIYGTRPLLFSHVLVRVSEAYALEMHIDVDEANAGGIKNNDIGIVQPKIL